MRTRACEPDGSWEGHGSIPGTVWGIVNITVFFAKVAAILVFFIWVRWTLPRFRYDQLMSLGWKFMLPLALACFTAVAGAATATAVRAL